MSPDQDRIHLPQAAPDTWQAAAAAHGQLRSAFSKPDVASLTVPIGLINSWNRVGIGFHMAPAVAA